MDQQLSSIQLHVLEIEASWLEQVQSARCDKLSGVESDELTINADLCPIKTTYYFLKGSCLSIALNPCQQQKGLGDKPLGPMIS